MLPTFRSATVASTLYSPVELMDSSYGWIKFRTHDSL